MSDNAAFVCAILGICSIWMLPIVFTGFANIIHAWRSTKCHCKEKGTNERTENDSASDNG